MRAAMVLLLLLSSHALARDDGRYANKVKVTFGRSSVNTIEVKDGLKVGDKVILSDMSAYDSYDRIRLN